MHLSIASMPVVPLFLFKVSVSLAVLWCFYQVVLRRLTFYRLNRWYLAGYTLLSFIIPLIDIGPLLEEGPAGQPVFLRFIPAIGGKAGSLAVPQAPAAGWQGWEIVSWILVLGAALALARLAIKWLSLVGLRRKARSIEGVGVKVYQVDSPVIPFSFGNAIYINRHLHTQKEWEDIILHEYVHIRQRHTLDILIAELLCAVNWFNPFAWLIRHSIRQNLEFIADQEVLDSGVDRKGYQYHLLHAVGEPRYRLANNFNFSSLRKRIIMMNKMRSGRAHLLKLLFLLPLAAVSLAAFRDNGMMETPYPGKTGTPKAPTQTAMAQRRSNSPQRRPGAVMDTVPEGRPVFIIDDKELPEDSIKNMNPETIASIDVLKDSTALNTPAYRKFGERRKNGIVIIHLKSEKKPLVLVDGQEMSWDAAKLIDPSKFASMQVWKAEEAKARYGEKGKNGVIVITLKEKRQPAGN